MLLQGKCCDQGNVGMVLCICREPSAWGHSRNVRERMQSSVDLVSAVIALVRNMKQGHAESSPIDMGKGTLRGCDTTSPKACTRPGTQTPQSDY